MFRTRAFALLGGLVVLAATATPVSAEPDHPSEQDVEVAREAEAAIGADVAAVEARLAEMGVELQRLHIDAAKAVEAYNGARLALEAAESAAVQASSRAAEATDAAEAARVQLGHLAAASYRNGSDLAAVGMILEARDSGALYDGVAALRSVAEGQAGVFERARAATADAEAAAADAAEALRERESAAAAARTAFDAASEAAGDQERALAAAEADRQAVLAELAVARGTTLELEQARQRGVEEAAAAERERRAVLAAPEPPIASTGSTALPQPDPASQPEPVETEPGPEVGAEARPQASDPAAVPDPSRPNPPGSGAQRAIDYARAQIGKPYAWGAAGPSSFDCSGLTMRAWEAGGVSLTHWSVAQARAVDRVSYAQLRPGDLVFWSDDGSASGVYHVGLYIGDGRMIHAPRPGKNVEVQNVFYWITPSFFGRVPLE